MRHGLLFIGGGVPLNQIVETAQAAESEGLDSIYCVEAYRSAFVPLAAIASATERVRIGPYILNAYGHSPYITGMSAIDLDELSGGRVVIGVGSGNTNINLDFQGLPTDRPLTKMREYVELLRTIVRTPLGGPVRYDGEVHRMHWEPRVQPIRDSIPIYLAAIFPKMVQVAGRVADGLAMGVLFSADYVRDVIRPSALGAAEDAGRDPAELEFPMGALIAVDDDRERARATVRAAICSFFDPIPHPYYEFLLREQGFSQVADACMKFVPEGKPEAAIEQMDDTLVDTLAFAGTPQDCARRVNDYKGLVDEVIYLNVGGADAGSVLDAHRGVLAVKGAATTD
jgi:5,10-methylenetetrahydromethanopterin reductase